MLKELRHSLTLTICFALLLLWTDNPSHAGHKHALIIKAKRQHTDRSEKQISASSASENDLKESQADNDKTQDKAAPELKQENINVEVLTGGKWVPLATSATLIETINQPLRITYHHFQQIGKTIPLNVILEKQKDHFVISKKRNKGLKSLYPSEKISVPSGYLANNQYSAIYPRLQPGRYTLTVAPKKNPNSKNRAEVWLKVSAAPLEPPIINAIDQRLAEQGDLSLKLKNITVGDQLTLFVNGESAKPRKISKESELDSYFAYGGILPPGPSTITVKVNRNGKESGYSQAVSVSSRSTIIMARNTNLIDADFKNQKKNKLDDPRLIDTTGFEFVNSRYSKKKKRKYVTKEELKQYFDEFTKTVLQQIQQAQTNQTLKQFEGQITSLKDEITALKKDLKTFNNNDEKRKKEILQELNKFRADFYNFKKCVAYQNSGWNVEPLLTWPKPEFVTESHLKKLDQLATHPLTTSSPLIDKKYSDKIKDACNKSGEFTLDITFKVVDPQQATNELMRMISFSHDPQQRNFTLGQYKDELVFRIRTVGTPQPAVPQPAAPTPPLRDPNGLSKTNGSQGIHFYQGLKAGKTYNVVISFYNQTLHFWLNGKKLPLEVNYANPISGWDDSFRLLLGNELVVPDDTRKWTGEVHSFSIRDRGVKLRKPDFDVFECVFSGNSAQNNPVVKNDPQSTKSSEKSESETEPIDLGTSESKKIEVREFAFPYPASFPVPRYHWDGHSIETEGAVLNQMRLAISKDGRYQLDFETRTTIRAEITLQLLVQLDNGQWYPLTLPKQTIVPSEYSHDHSQPANYAGTKTIKGYAPVLANRSEQIRDIRRRGNALFGTAPYINQ